MHDERAKLQQTVEEVLMDSPKQAVCSAEKELGRMRTQFVERVTAENLTQLLEALVTDNVLNELEKERIQETNQSRADKARDFIDTVKKKGEKACRIMISHLRTIDPTVSCQLGLSSGPSAPLGCSSMCQNNHKSVLKKKFQCVFEGVARAGNPTLLNQIYTELFITEGGTAEVNQEHEKFTLDWAEDKTNQDIQFIFPFPFRELNVLKEKKFSLVELVHRFFTETKEAGICRFEDFQVVFIFDGLDECRLPLDFHSTEILTDPRESTSVVLLLTNLIKGNLLPSAHLWITTRPAAANQIPSDCVDMVTEIRGFTDPQKEEYFKKRFTNEKRSSRIISHIKTSRSLHIMCHIPVFCWITATVLEHMLRTTEVRKLPKTLTEMYIHFLVVQVKVKKVKYDGGAETDPPWSPESRKMIESLGKLAFEQLQKGKLIFYESDLTECGIDIRAASVYSGVFTQIFKEERGLYQDKVFCFIHLSVQEFLAALHVHLTFINTGVNLLEEQQTDKHFYQSAVDKALQSPNGHLDLFLRFLLGLSLQTNQSRLQGLLKQTSSPQTNQEVVQYIKKKLNENLPTEKSINLFHCLNELNDRSLVKEIQQALSSGSLSTDKLSPAEWSALVFTLLSSEEDLDEFDLKKYAASEEALLRLMPVVKASNKALLSGCNLSERSCGALFSVSLESSNLIELDLNNNDLKDSGVMLLSSGLKSLQCNLHILRLSGCLITEHGCASLASALRSNSQLRELDLSYNHPGEAGKKQLKQLRMDIRLLPVPLLEEGVFQKLAVGLGVELDSILNPKRPHKLIFDDTSPNQYSTSTLLASESDWSSLPFTNPATGPSIWPIKTHSHFINSCQLTIDTNTVNKNLKLSDNNRKVTRVKKIQSYPDHPDRFDDCPQLLCTDPLTGRCYWEVEWRGDIEISVAGSSPGLDSLSRCVVGQDTSPVAYWWWSEGPVAPVSSNLASVIESQRGCGYNGG
ncbi:G protein-coupled receptor [Sarotherodon galilaeus]